MLWDCALGLVGFLMYVCAEPGCPNLTDTTRCQVHTKAKKRAEDRRRPSARARGYDTKWQKTRARHLRVHPLCQHPEGCIERATDVHHLDGLGPKGPRGHDPSNLQALCHEHHSRITATSQPGGWNA